MRHILGRASISTPSGMSGPSGVLSTAEPPHHRSSVAVNLEPDENNDAVCCNCVCCQLTMTLPLP